ncbi:hypothetical protein GCM10010280_35320 [Streptomyces pilosus]|uniref:Uncharacterized protein n=1 Tax=Streptomyces pilosus TaxID=28893 RepID=A0A918BSI0_9ACTN|nr:hypothetical protein GCM10010280_35320 [Streptomyces pilosus]
MPPIVSSTSASVPAVRTVILCSYDGQIRGGGTRGLGICIPREGIGRKGRTGLTMYPLGVW